MSAKHFVILLAFAACVLHSTSAKDRVLVTRPADAYYTTLISIDGGGLRQYMTNQLLKEVERQIKKHFLKNQHLLPEGAGPVEDIDDLEVHLADFFDCMAGVSSGSWSALYYASKGGNGVTAQFLARPDIRREYGDIYAGSARGLDVFFEEFSGVIYPQDLRYHLPRPRFQRFPLDIPGFNTPRYPADGLERALDAFYGDTKLSELHTCLIVNAYEIAHRFPVLFTFNALRATNTTSVILARTRSARLDGDQTEMQETLARMSGAYESRRLDLDIRLGQDFYIKDIARASSALPAFHPAKVVPEVGNNDVSYTCIDGALVGPNPTMHAMNFLLSTNAETNISMLAAMSFGTGTTIGDWSASVGRGLYGWGFSGDLLTIVVDGGSEALQSNVDFLLYDQLRFQDGQYLRIQVFRDDTTAEGRALDGIGSEKKLGALRRIGESGAKQYEERIRSFVRDFIFGTEKKEAPPARCTQDRLPT